LRGGGIWGFRTRAVSSVEQSQSCHIYLRADAETQLGTASVRPALFQSNTAIVVDPTIMRTPSVHPSLMLAALDRERRPRTSQPATATAFLGRPLKRFRPASNGGSAPSSGKRDTRGYRESNGGTPRGRSAEHLGYDAAGEVIADDGFFDAKRGDARRPIFKLWRVSLAWCLQINKAGESRADSCDDGETCHTP